MLEQLHTHLQYELSDATSIHDNLHLAFTYLHCNLEGLEEAVQIAFSKV